MVRDVIRSSKYGNEAAASTHQAGRSASLQLRIITHNIRYATSNLENNERPWEERCPLILSQLKYHTRFLDGASSRLNDRSTPSTRSAVAGSFICLQEVLHIQLHDILTGLNSTNNSLPQGPIWNYIGVARDDGKAQGEYNPILYPANLFKCLHFETTWLSPTPEKPSKGWGAGCKRILTTGVFECRFSGARMVVGNTHFDNFSSGARRRSVSIVLEVMERTRRELDTDGDGLGFVLAGDFNSFPGQEAHRGFVGSGVVVDAYSVVPDEDRYGNEVTFTSFRPGSGEHRDEIGRIDFVWLGPKEGVRANGEDREAMWDIKGYSVLPNVFDDGVFASDHRAVVVDAILHG